MDFLRVLNLIEFWECPILKISVFNDTSRIYFLTQTLYLFSRVHSNIVEERFLCLQTMTSIRTKYIIILCLIPNPRKCDKSDFACLQKKKKYIFINNSI